MSWEIIADNLSKAGWSWGCVSAIDSNGRTITATVTPAERHCCLIRTGLAACVTNPMRIGGMAMATRGVGVDSVIQGGDD